ncbi:MAG: anti-sigma factor [Alphaproteobacteria bacterium]|nr:anti-sigma factor [Alphaproteobacteria bacterium]
MTPPPAPVDDFDLHGYVDHQLPPARREEVATYLAANPEAAARVADYQSQNQALGAAFEGVLAEPVPPAMLTRRRPWLGAITRIAAALALLFTGGTAGWLAHDSLLAPSAIERTVAEPAAYAHRAFAGEFRHPVEIWGDNEPHLVTWLSSRLGMPVRPPDLNQAGYWLVGGRLLPARGGAAAQFMYQDDKGGRITLYVRTGIIGNSESRFQFFDQQGVRLVYWVDGPVGYALTGPVDREHLLHAAQLAYGQTKR